MVLTLIAQSSGAVYNGTKNLVRYIMGERRHAKDLEPRISQLILNLEFLLSEKNRIDQSLRASVSTEKTDLYELMMAEIDVIDKECIELLSKYTKLTKNELSPTTPSLSIEMLNDVKSNAQTFKFVKLAKLSRDVAKLNKRALDAEVKLNMVQKLDEAESIEAGAQSRREEASTSASGRPDAITAVSSMIIDFEVVSDYLSQEGEDEMYDRRTPVIIRDPESSSEKWSRRLEEKYEDEEPRLEGKKMEHEHPGTDQPVSTLSGDDVQQDQYGGTSAGASSTEVEAVKLKAEHMMQKAKPNEPKHIDSDSSFISRFKIRHAEVSKTSSVKSNTSSLPKSKIKQAFADESAKMGPEAKMSTTMPISVVSSFTSQQRVDSDRHEEVQAVDEISAWTYPKKHSIEQQETEPTSSNAQGNKHHEESVTSPIYFQEKGHYLVILEDKHLQLKMDNQTISIGYYPPANAMLNLAEQDLHELPEKPNYPNSLILLLQRNKRLTLINRSFFDTMPDLCFLDMSDTKIRILPTSLFELSKLKVLMLRNCICLDELPPEIGKLRHMEALDLSGTELYKVPDEIGQLTLMRSMQLSFYGPDDESEYEDLPSRLVSPSFLSELKGIEALSVSVHPEDHRWTKTVADMIKYISKLERLSYLHFYFPQVEMFESFIQTSPSWKKESLRKFEFTIGQNVKRIASRVPDEVESLFSREERCLRYVNGDKVSPLIKSALTQVTSFYLDHHTEARSLSEFGSSNFHELKFCLVRECPKMQAILDEKIAGTAFPCLEYLGIYFLWELKQVWKPVPQAGRVKRIFKTPTTLRSFEALRYLTISTCPKLRFILWESMLQCFANLEELVVEDCEHVEEIIKEEKKKVKYENNALPGLRKLVLRYLPELVGLGCGIRLSEEKISVYGCPKLIPNSLVDAMRRLTIDKSDQVSSSTEVELQKENVGATPVENQGSEPTSTSESTLVPDAVVPKTFPVDSSSSSLSIEIKVIFPKTSEAKISEHHREIQEADDPRTSTDTKYSGEQRETEPTSSSNAKRSMHHEESIASPIYFQEEVHYLVVLKDNKHLRLEFNNQSFLIGDYPSAVNPMLNLVEQDLHELPGNKPNYPNSLILLLQRNKRLSLIHRSFFDTMPDLSFLDMSDTKIRNLPSSLFELSKLKVLMLRNCICLEELPKEIGKLRRMEALDLSGTELNELPDEIGELTSLRSMQLSFYGPDDESEYEDLPSRLVSPSFLSELEAVEALSVSVHPEDQRWTESVAGILKDISRLERLSYLHFYFPQVETFESFIQTSPSWKKQSLRKFEFTVGQNVKRIASRVPDEVESLFSREERCLRYVNGDKVSPLIQSVLTHVTSFYLDHHTEAQSLSEFDNSNFHELRFCLVRECPKMQAILDEENAGSAFPCLEYLGIYFLWELKQVWKPVPQTGRVKRIFKTATPLRSFEALRYLIISTCPKLCFILQESMLQCFAKLEELIVEDCERVEEIIKKENEKVKYENNALPSLRKLELRYLPELVGLGCGIRLSKEEISVYGCPKLILNS